MVRTKRMKRLMMLGALLLIFALVGCNNAPQTPTPTTSTEPPQTPPDTPPEEPDPPVTPPNPPSDEASLHPDLIASMVEYLQQLGCMYDLYLPGFDGKIDLILKGETPFHVKFDSANYYYACGYYESTHVEANRYYCCADDYTWVRFENEADISETYNGQKLIVTLQVNKATVCQNILVGEPSNTTMEHYQLYKPEFQNGVNVASAKEFDSEFIFISDSEKNNLYCCDDYVLFPGKTFSCIELDRQCYLKEYLYTIRSDGTRDESALQMRFGRHYTALMEIVITDRYSITTENGSVKQYGLFELEAFASFLQYERLKSTIGNLFK